jgi:hypothetical protein
MSKRFDVHAMLFFVSFFSSEGSRKLIHLKLGENNDMWDTFSSLLKKFATKSEFNMLGYAACVLNAQSMFQIFLNFTTPIQMSNLLKRRAGLSCGWSTI